MTRASRLVLARHRHQNSVFLGVNSMAQAVNVSSALLPVRFLPLACLSFLVWCVTARS
jgi:hypothetical protein